MRPWQEVKGAAASEADAQTHEAYLAAVRAAWADRWDIHEVFGGYLAVPAGTPILQASTPGGLNGKLERYLPPEPASPS